MTDGSETRYSPGIRAEIERRWQDAPTYLASGTGPITARMLYEVLHDRPGYPADFDPPLSQKGRLWLFTHLHAQEDIQILLEGLATAERSLLAATARIAEVEACRREDCDRYTAMVRRVGEANLELRRIIEEERKERDDG